MEIIVQDVSQLETDGIYIPELDVLKGTIICLSNDNLAANYLLGLTTSFSTKFCCRFCKADLSNVKQASEDCDSLIRNDFYVDLENNLEPQQKKKNEETWLEKTRGVKMISALSTLKYFSVSTGSSVDIFHDLYEGVVVFALSTVFEHFKSKRILTIEKIKERVNQFKYGKLNRAHTPSNIQLERKSNLGLSGMQLKTLILYFPFIFGDCFNDKKNMKAYELITSLIQIITIVNKPKLTENDLSSLKIAVDIHLDIIVNEFKLKLKPKHHHLVHYVRIIRRLGE